MGSAAESWRFPDIDRPIRPVTSKTFEASFLAAPAAEVSLPPVSELPENTSLCTCTGLSIPSVGPDAVGGARRWLSISRALRRAPTAESRLKLLMQLSLERSHGTPDGHSERSRLCRPSETPGSTLQRNTSQGTNIVAAPSSATNATAAVESPLLTLADSWRPVNGCAASAFVRVSLHLPATFGYTRRNTSMSHPLCCTAAREGVRVHIQTKSDSLVVGGLLYMLSRGLSGGPPCGVWALETLGPTQLLQRSSLVGLLPDTRVKGLRAALQVLAESTRDLLQQLFVDKEPSSCEVSEGAALVWGPKSIAAVKAVQASASTERLPDATYAPIRAAKRRTEEVPEGKNSLVGASLRYSQLPLGDSDPSDVGVPPLGPPTSLMTHDVATAALSEQSRRSLPVAGGAGDEVHVLVSGGVDSSVSLMLLREWGFRPKPVFLKVWAPEAAQLKLQLQGLQEQQLQQEGTVAAAAAAAAAATACPWRADVEAASLASAAAGLALEVVPMQQEYWERVITAFLEGARSGLTLNPDWSCNRLVKFGAFMEALGDTEGKIASGHYARVCMQQGVPRLLRGSDGAKDQSYFLSGLTLHQLSRVLFPVGPLLKTQVRRIALRWRLPSAQRPDSQGLCFLGPLAVGPFLSHILGDKGGPVMHYPSGTLIGRHRGLWGFTAGQQKGVVPLLDPVLCRRCRGASGGPPTLSGPWSVVGKDPEANALFVVSREEEEAAEAHVRAVAAGSREHKGLALLEGAAKGDRRAFLAIKLRQLRTHLRVDSIQWIGGIPPPEFVAASSQVNSQNWPRPFTGNAAAADAASRAAAAARKGLAILSGRPPGGAQGGPPGENADLIVQVRHSAGFVGVAKHKFKILSATEGRLGVSRSLGEYSAEAELLLDEPDVGLAPGQVAVFYRGDECLGSGRISPHQGISFLREALNKSE
ncbi:tRNA methyltransferase domain-containing protein [Cyclospora cayetanensis]|uniref:tRNA-5-taurinomethyluridine 2-sulfurtransferase n=1 Tax=Cyclospora cayetanensis TaxID=88456 RepID=A0A1D3D0N7_9EIME|nr:tRNA methyltransferase domain-containing protein [Cyclospora cayetanensis]